MPSPRKPRPEPPLPPAEPAPSGTAHPARDFDTERLLRALQRLQGGQDFKDLEEVQAFFDQFKGMKVQDVQALAGHDIREEAQELAFQAMEADSMQHSADLARRALALDPASVDARSVLLAAEATSPGAYLEDLARLVKEAESAVPPPLLKEHRGRLWGCLEARPYLRARMSLAGLLARSGRLKEAVAHLEALLALNESDNQGARYHLLRCLALLGRGKELRDLLQRFQEEESALMAWARLLSRLKQEAEPAVPAKGRRKALADPLQLLERARAANPLVEDYLGGRRRMPRKVLPRAGAHPAGSEDEALTVLGFLGEAWMQDRAAMYWLMKAGRKQSDGDQDA